MGSYEDVNLDVIEEPLSVIEQNLSFSVSVQSGFEEQACLEAACRVFESNVELASAPDVFLGSSEVDDTCRVSSVEVTQEGMKVLCVNKDDLVGEGENVGDLMLEKVPGNECGISGDCLDEILCLGDVCSLENGGLCLEKEGSQGEGDYEKPLESSPLTDLQRNCVQMDEMDGKCVSSSSAERVTEVKTDQSGVLDGAETDIHSLISSSQGCEMPSDLILKTGLPNNHTQQYEQEDTKSVGGLSSEVMYGKRASSAETETIFCNPILLSGDLVSNSDWHSDQKDEKNVSDLSAETVTEILETNNDVDTCTQASTSWGCQSDSENLHKAESRSICAKQNEQSGVLDGVETDIHNLISSSQGCEMPSDLVLKTGLPDIHTQQNEQEDTKSVVGLSLEVMDGKSDSSAETETAFCKPILPSGDLVSNGDWHSDQKVEKTVSDLSEETFTEILETKNDVDTCTQASTSWGCQSDSENLHKAESLSICAKQNEQKDGEDVDGPCVERVSNVVQDKGDIITVVSVEFDSHILPLEENSCKSEEGDTKIVDNCNFEKLVSPQSCQPFGIVNHSTSKDTPDQDAVGSINSSSVVESSGHTDNEGKDNVRVGCVSETKCPEVVSSSSRRNSQRSKSRQKTHRKRAAKKCKNAANVPHPHESIGIVLKVGRRKRSCLSKPARSSMWGLLGHITQFLEQGNMLDGVNQFHNQGLGKARRGQGSGKRKKIRGSGNSGGSRGNRCASTGLIRLKVKVGKVAGESCLSNMVPEVVNTLASADATASDDQTEMHSGTGLELSKLANGVEAKSREDETGLHLQCFSKLPEKAKTLPDGFIMDGQLATSGSENTNILDKTAGDADNYLEVPSHVVVEALGGEIDSKCTDPGTSPDSEVINLIPDVQVAARHQADLHDAVLTASKDVAARRRRTSIKRGKKDRLPRSRNSVLEDGSQGPVSMNEAKPSKKQGCRQDIRSQKVDGIGKATTGDDTAVTNKSDLEMVRGGLEEQLLPPRKAWVLCDDCHKWRRIPAVLADFIEKTNCTWTCKDNLDKAFAACSIPQEKSNAEINVELDISDASGEEDACGARLNFKGLDCRRSTGYQDSTFKCISTNEFLHRKRRSQTIDEGAFDTCMAGHMHGKALCIMLRSKNTREGYSIFQQSLALLLLAVVVSYPMFSRVPCCKPPSKGQLGCGEGCLNRMLSIECVQGACPCGDLCSNQQFQKQKYANLEWFRCGKKGYGLKLLEDIPEGKFLIEYVGEVSLPSGYSIFQQSLALLLLAVVVSYPMFSRVPCCKPPSKGQLGCGEGCLNRMLSIECVQGACPCGDLCSNQQFQKQKYANLEWFRCGKKGYGLKLLEDIPEGKFLIEYVGEVLNMQAYEARQKEYALNGHRHFYFMTLNGSEAIDCWTIVSDFST
ncbi:histone-lysine n-methyltransferase ashh2 [Quercus suber]|uniref:Histone-lysine n-methyltransferase ashh2 n=1 Tax=Quercus suber TaxID=58331 RepID=A0AAW0MC20_QUESU